MLAVSNQHEVTVSDRYQMLDNALLNIISTLKAVIDYPAPNTEPINYHLVTALSDVIKSVHVVQLNPFNDDNNAHSRAHVMDLLYFLSRSTLQTAEGLYQRYLELSVNLKHNVFDFDDFVSAFKDMNERYTGSISFYHGEIPEALLFAMNPDDYSENDLIHWDDYNEPLQRISLMHRLWNVAENEQRIYTSLANTLKEGLVAPDDMMLILEEMTVKNSTHPAWTAFSAVEDLDRFAVVLNVLAEAYKTHDRIFKRHNVDMEELVALVSENMHLSPSLLFTLVRK